MELTHPKTAGLGCISWDSICCCQVKDGIIPFVWDSPSGTWVNVTIEELSAFQSQVSLMFSFFQEILVRLWSELSSMSVGISVGR
jgi:hypothetical protein